MQTKIIKTEQLHGKVSDINHGRLYFVGGDGAANTHVETMGNLSIIIKFDCLVNITGISIQGKSSVSEIQFTKRYAVNVSYGNEDKKNHILGEVERKYLFVSFHQLVYLTKSNLLKKP